METLKKLIFSCFLAGSILTYYPQNGLLSGFVSVKGGIFGSGDIVTDSAHTEARVEDFEILDHPVTNAKYKRFTNATGYLPPLRWANGQMTQDPGVPVQMEAFSSYGRSLWRKDICYHDHCYGSANNAPFNVWDMDNDGKSDVITRIQMSDSVFLTILDGMTGTVKHKNPVAGHRHRFSTIFHPDSSFNCLSRRQSGTGITGYGSHTTWEAAILPFITRSSKLLQIKKPGAMSGYQEMLAGKKFKSIHVGPKYDVNAL